MFIAPAEVQDQKLKRRFRGYNRVSVEKLLQHEVERLKGLEQELHANLRSFLRSGLQLVEDRKTTQPSPVTAVSPEALESAGATTQKTAATGNSKAPSPATHKTPDTANA